ncbi:hypothetical protein ES705_26382 [subsurface metagenome]
MRKVRNLYYQVNFSVISFKKSNMRKVLRNCFGCWVRTPGECVAKDDSGLVCRELVRSDLVLFASSVIMGFPEAAHSRMVERYNEKLASRMGCRYPGKKNGAYSRMYAAPYPEK